MGCFATPGNKNTGFRKDSFWNMNIFTIFPILSLSSPALLLLAASRALEPIAAYNNKEQGHNINSTSFLKPILIQNK